jgi:hypothetical protein
MPLIWSHCFRTMLCRTNNLLHSAGEDACKGKPTNAANQQTIHYAGTEMPFWLAGCRNEHIPYSNQPMPCGSWCFSVAVIAHQISHLDQIPAIIVAYYGIGNSQPMDVANNTLDTVLVDLISKHSTYDMNIGQCNVYRCVCWSQLFSGLVQATQYNWLQIPKVTLSLHDMNCDVWHHG